MSFVSPSSYCPNLGSLDPLRGCIKLEVLDISYCNRLSQQKGTLECIGGCLRMRSLGMSGIGASFTMEDFMDAPEVIAAELGHLRGMRELEEVYADRNVVVGPGPPLQGGVGVSLVQSFKAWTGGA